MAPVASTALGSCCDIGLCPSVSATLHRLPALNAPQKTPQNRLLYPLLSN
jgi:hypothetical protein